MRYADRTRIEWIERIKTDLNTKKSPQIWLRRLSESLEGLEG